uniref:NADH-ubiquinone oxidoreductase chain 4L n=1 Tax=Anisosticta novemdecimpunctata TaxID=185876 RepID=A0A191ZQT2_ANINO|nr:NADH dehydrogenase subunit 4L [Anisosticta novemdecimpunctata]
MMILKIYLFLMSIMSFALNRKHVLTMLLSMELVILVLFFIMYMNFASMIFEFYFVLIFLTLSVCESALGLSLMVSIIRSYGNDNFNLMNLLW